MDLYTALGFDNISQERAISIAFVGAGGKTTALFQLARQFIRRNYRTVYVSTTTHLGEAEKNLADHVVFLHSSDDLAQVAKSVHEGVVLICGATENNLKLGGLPKEQIEILWSFAQRKGIPLLVEADGSRRRPLKAPADFEPEIPDFINHVIVVAGLSGLGKQLCDEFVHRPEIFAGISKQTTGSIIKNEQLIDVLLSPYGGLKRIPKHAFCTVLLNQSDTLKRFKDGREIAKGLLKGFDRVIIAHLGINAYGIQAVYEPLAGIVLAAGASSRFGKPKQLAEWEGQSVLQYVIQKSLACEMQYLQVVLGSDREKILQSLSNMGAFRQKNISVIENAEWRRGQSTSIRIGIQNLPSRVGGAIFILADQPMVPIPIFETLQDVRAFTRSWVVAPTYQGKRTNPVLFGRELFDDMMHLKGDIGGRFLLKEPISFPVSWVPWDDPGLTLDFDTMEDYQTLIEKRL